MSRGAGRACGAAATERLAADAGLLGVTVGQLMQVGISTGSSLWVLVPGTLVTSVFFGVPDGTRRRAFVM